MFSLMNAPVLKAAKLMLRSIMFGQFKPILQNGRNGNQMFLLHK